MEAGFEPTVEPVVEPVVRLENVSSSVLVIVIVSEISVELSEFVV